MPDKESSTETELGIPASQSSLQSAILPVHQTTTQCQCTMSTPVYGAEQETNCKIFVVIHCTVTETTVFSITFY